MDETLYYAKVNDENILLLESHSNGERNIFGEFKQLVKKYPQYKGNLYALVDGVEITINWNEFYLKT